MNTLDRSTKLQLQLTKLTLQILISQQTVSKIQAEIRESLRPAGTPLAEHERAAFSELSATCKRLDEFLAEMLAVA